MKTSDFFQNAPTLANQYNDDLHLQNILKNTLPTDIFNSCKSHLEQIGEDASHKLLAWAEEAEANEPILTQYDTWGHRIDRITMNSGWKNIEAYAAENGLIAAGYERKQSEWSRVYQMAMLYLFHPSSAFVSCPLAMTDGAAKLIETYGDINLKIKPFQNLTSRVAKNFWTSGQWMTEKIGGSDVGGTETLAQPTKSGYALYGTKWFTSAATSPVAMTLARIEGAESGNRGLSLFYLETGISTSKLNNIEILRLKDKLGTRAMPTAELKLNGSAAQLVGDAGNGVKKISTLFNITRIYNSVCSVAQMRRAIALASNYSIKREAFGKRLIDHALFCESFADALVEFEGCLHLIFRLAHLLGKDDTNTATKRESALVRLFTPMTKLYTGKSTVSIVSEMVEIFAGTGYCEDSGIPKLIRDAQVFPIWEGTTNVLSLDVLRALKKDCPYNCFLEEVQERIGNIPENPLKMKLIDQLQELTQFEKELSSKDPEFASASARQFAWLLCRVYIGSLLMASAHIENSPRATSTLKRWLNNTHHAVHASRTQRDETSHILKV